MGGSGRHRYVPSPIYQMKDMEALTARLQANSNAQINAHEVIYAAISRWARMPVERGGSIPIVRDGKVAEWRPAHSPFDPITPILRASKVAPVPQLKLEEAQLEKLMKALQSVRQCMETLDVEFSHTLDRTWTAPEQVRGDPVDVVHALGIERSLTIALHGALQNIRQRLNEIREELALQPSGKGRPPFRPAYEVAKQFAQLYVQVTGRRPTCSVSDSMVSGEFAPALRDLFDVFGWTDIRGPGNAAVESITDEYLHNCEAPRKGIFGGLSGLGQ